MNVSNRKMVFITLTAGDGSVGAGSYGSSGVPFYLSRELGAVYSCKYAADLTTGTAPLDAPTVSMVTINGKSIAKYIYKNTVNYFFRLPDGNGDGSGFNNNGNQSLQKLKLGTITAINAVGNTTSPPTNGPSALTYTWSELIATIRLIINNEKVSGTQSWIHTASTNTSTYNINDHSDHIYSSIAVQDAITLPSNLTWTGVNGFRDYNSSNFVGNLSSTDHENASALFALANWGLIEAQYATNFNAGHKVWLPMDYFEVLKTPTGTARNVNAGKESDNLAETPENEISGKNIPIEIPMIVTMTSPVFVNKEISMFISPYETGELITSLFDENGKKITELKTIIKEKNGVLVTLKQLSTIKGTYFVKNLLNNKYTETRKIVVE